MREPTLLTKSQLKLLNDIQSIPVQDFSMDDIMILGGKRLIEFSDSGNFKLTSRGEELLVAMTPS